MRPREVGVLFLMCAVVLHASDAQFAIPDVDIQALTTGGFRASIPDVPGIKMFGFHGRISDIMNAKEGGRTDGDVMAPENGRWIFTDSEAKLQEDDVLNYKVFVRFHSLGYQRDGLSYTVKNFVPTNTPWPSSGGIRKPVGPGVDTKPTTVIPACTKSSTTINDGRPTCAGQLIFEENFNNPLDPGRWIVEHRLPADDQENEFVSYQRMNVKTSKNWLTISPTILQSLGFTREQIISDGVLDLSAGCTAQVEEFCKTKSDYLNILPPVVSGKISSRGLFSFKYGKVEIRAKFPLGEWLYPELYLLPQTSQYGVDRFKSGIIRVGFARGNRDIDVAGKNIGSIQLSGGVVLHTDDSCRSLGTVSKTAEIPWGNEFHTYGIVWTKDSISYSVDGVSYGEVTPPEDGFKSLSRQCFGESTWPTESKIAPFDQEFYISLGLGVGGNSDFLDGVGGKPWSNKSPKARSQFFRAINSWRDTWVDDSKSLSVQSVKVWAL